MSRQSSVGLDGLGNAELTAHRDLVLRQAYNLLASSVLYCSLGAQTMAPRLPFDLESLSTAIPAVLDQVQSSAATHKKNCVALFKLHNASSSVVETVNRGRKGDEIKLIGEKAFLDIFLEMMNRVVVIKKGIPTADRIVKFVGSYVQFINDKSA